ncbi:hypothetical protein NE237_001098 [Protea cynaroides]|uniref:Reverse transcriptase/retrotransposon-derived protein RNase H-like domain-containing protein n=1 Tax=Protea cynaroides TaxID=273540 RepID=A0A9Q0KSN8_9MAGN|nr:hypothetical protein NE237_001098 [Protea cynaroides]
MLKNGGFHWTDDSKAPFRLLQQALTCPPVLALPDFTNPFVIKCSGPEIGIGAVLLQSGRPLALLQPSSQWGYSTRAGPLMDLLKKSTAWQWSDACQHAFEELKEAVTEEPVLALPDYGKPFEVLCDWWGAVVRWTLNCLRELQAHETERRYTVHDKEMTAVGTLLQQCWLSKLLGYDFLVEYGWGSLDKAADALSRRDQDVNLHSVSQAVPMWMQDFENISKADPDVVAKFNPSTKGSST